MVKRKWPWRYISGANWWERGDTILYPFVPFCNILLYHNIPYHTKQIGGRREREGVSVGLLTAEEGGGGAVQISKCTRP